MMNAWIWLILAGLLEVTWVIALKYSHGFQKLWPSVICLISMALSVLFLGIAQRTLPLGLSYAVWVGIGVMGASIIGMWLFHEPKNAMTFLCLGLVMAGIIGLKLSSTAHG